MSFTDNDINMTSINKTTTKTSKPIEYSEEIDPYLEAKWYDSNFLLLANAGYNICNGLMAEAGFGAAHHSSNIHMTCFILFKKL